MHSNHEGVYCVAVALNHTYKATIIMRNDKFAIYTYIYYRWSYGGQVLLGGAICVIWDGCTVGWIDARLCRKFWHTRSLARSKTTKFSKKYMLYQKRILGPGHYHVIFSKIHKGLKNLINSKHCTIARMHVKCKTTI